MGIMQGQMKRKILPYILLVLGGLGDALTTYYYLSLPTKRIPYNGGYWMNTLFETRPLFVPFLSTILLSISIYAVNLKQFRVPSLIKKGLTVFIVAMSFVPAILNITLIWSYFQWNP